MTYGLSCAPYLALRVLQQLVEDKGSPFPRASTTLLRSTYNDNILTGADDLDGVFQLQDELIQMLYKDGSPFGNGSRIIPISRRKSPKKDGFDPAGRISRVISPSRRSGSPGIQSRMNFGIILPTYRVVGLQRDQFCHRNVV